MAGEGQQLRVVAHKNAGHMGDDEHGNRRHHHGHHADEPEALGVKVVQLGMVASTVVVADDGRAAHGIAHEDRHEQEGRIHDDAVSRHAVLPGKAEELIIIEDVDEGHGEVGHQLGGAVDAGGPQHAAVELCPAQMDAAGVLLFQEIKHRQYTAHQLADEGGHRGTRHTQMERPNQHHVQHHVGAACAYGKQKAQLGLFGRDEKALEKVL